jgi:hypothetical protein
VGEPIAARPSERSSVAVQRVVIAARCAGRDPWRLDTVERPGPSARPCDELSAAVAGLRPWLRSDDARVKALAVGAFRACRWVTGGSTETPVSTEQVAESSLRDQLAEWTLATMVAAGFLPAPVTEGWSDLGRLLARGSEAWFLWWLWPAVPCPALLRPGSRYAEAAVMLGDVGTGAEGLHGPSISAAAFPTLSGAWLLPDR